MTWFWYALAAPLFMAVCNHFDKYLLEKYYRSKGSLVLILISSVASIIFIPITYFLGHQVFALSGWQILWLIVQSIIQIIALWIYLHVLEHEETSVVVPFFQILPIFYFVLGWLFLGETLTLNETIGAVIVISGALVLSLERGTKKKYSLNTKLLGLMFLSAFLLALSGVAFKALALEVTFWNATFWDYTGWLLFSVALIAFWPPAREAVTSVLRQNKPGLIPLNIANESVYLVGELAARYATLLAPIALVETVSAFQPVFVLLFGICLTILLPRIAKESLVRRDLIQKGGAVAVILIGSVILNLG